MCWQPGSMLPHRAWHRSPLPLATRRPATTCAPYAPVHPVRHAGISCTYEQFLRSPQKGVPLLLARSVSMGERGKTERPVDSHPDPHSRPGHPSRRERGDVRGGQLVVTRRRPPRRVLRGSRGLCVCPSCSYCVACVLSVSRVPGGLLRVPFFDARVCPLPLAPRTGAGRTVSSQTARTRRARYGAVSLSAPRRWSSRCCEPSPRRCRQGFPARRGRRYKGGERG